MCGAPISRPWQGQNQLVCLPLWRTPASHLPLQRASPKGSSDMSSPSLLTEAADISETNGKCPLTRLPGHPRLLLPNCLWASLGGAVVAGLISWEDPAPFACLLLSDPILSWNPRDPLAQQLCWATLVPRSPLPDVDFSASWPWRLPLGSGSRHLPWRGRVNYRCGVV